MSTVEQARKHADQCFRHDENAPTRYTLAMHVLALADEVDRLTQVETAARSVHAGLTCLHDPMDVDERLAKLAAALALPAVEVRA